MSPDYSQLGPIGRKPIDRLAHKLEQAGLVVTFIDGAKKIIELEFDRANRGRFPHKYAILGLRLERGGRVAYSIEPMHKPLAGDTRSDKWRKGETVREEILQVLLCRVRPVLIAMQFTLDVEVSNIHE